MHTLKCAARAARHPVIAAAGVKEFRRSSGLTFDGDPTSPRSSAYDSGRELTHIVTFRYWDSE